MNLAVAGLLMIMIASTALAQDTQQASTGSHSDAATLPEFEVVAVSEVKASDTGRRQSSSWTQDGYFAENIQLKRLVCFAYGVPWDRVNGGQGWIEKSAFDIQAKVSDADTRHVGYNINAVYAKKDQLKSALANMTAAHQGFLEVLDKDQTTELGRKLGKLEGLQSDLTLQIAHLNEELAVVRPDPFRVSTRLYGIGKSIGKWRSLHRKIAKEMSIQR